MKELNKIKGDEGELQARNFLKKKGYKILGTNVKNNVGEIDIVAKHKKTIVFVEVKMRQTSQFGLPREAVTERKQAKIRGAAQLYLMQNNLLGSAIRFDVVDILDGEISHIEGAFDF